MKKFSLLLMWLAAAWGVQAAAPRTIYLYDGDMPYDNGYTQADEYVGYDLQIYKTSNPRIDLYMPDRLTGTDKVPVILCCPGGAYVFTSTNNEGAKVAQFFTPRGWAVAVLKYRMPNGRERIPLADACRAMELIRDSADAWHLDGFHIGVMGFSAGGHLASTLVTQYSSEKARPDFGVLVYPVISMDSTLTHKTTCHELLGDHPSDEKRQEWSSNLRVSETTPPCFLVACQDDKSVKVENSILMYQALTKAGVEAEMILLPIGGHGFGFSRHFPERETYESALMTWLMRRLKIPAETNLRGS